MYFHNRAEAGRILANGLLEYAHQSVAVIALRPGGVIVGAQIAMKLHGSLAVLLTENVILPGEIDSLAAVTSDNTFTYNRMFSPGQIEEFYAEYHGIIDTQRLEKLYHLHALLGPEGEINKELLKRHIVILVSDGFSDGLSLDAASEFLKPVKMKKLVVATPLASVPAVDKMHLIGDEVHCLSVVQNFMEVDHYYEDNTIPSTQDLFKVIRNIPIHWERAKQTS
jgi:predicted phosphoribosyltransferase